MTEGEFRELERLMHKLKVSLRGIGLGCEVWEVFAADCKIVAAYLNMRKTNDRLN